MSNLGPSLTKVLQTIEPGASFSGAPPRMTSQASNKSYFCKVGSPGEAEQYQGEATSLEIFQKISPGLAPQVLATGTDESSQRPYMVSEYLDLSGGLNERSARQLAERLATEVHMHTSDRGFGFPAPTHCGVTRFENEWKPTWQECYDGMIGSLLDRIEAKRNADADLVAMGAQIRSKVIPHLLGPRLKVEPSFLHGDLWSGNVALDPEGNPVIYDPSSYFGHNEAELSITKIFGGFPKSFYETYHKFRPKSEPVEEYEQRQQLYELFHYLNHTLMFGNSYAGPAKSRMRGLLNFVNKL